jgi:hypothetical protein
MVRGSAGKCFGKRTRTQSFEVGFILGFQNSKGQRRCGPRGPANRAGGNEESPKTTCTLCTGTPVSCDTYLRNDGVGAPRPCVPQTTRAVPSSLSCTVASASTWSPSRCTRPYPNRGFALPSSSDSAGGLTLSRPDPAIRRFWLDRCLASRRISDHMGREQNNTRIMNIWISDGRAEP